MHEPFDADTIAGLYPTHEAYVAAIREAADQNIRDGSLLREDARDIVARAKRSVVGTGLVCGRLCANVRTFLQSPSPAILRDQTDVYHFRGEQRLLAPLDRATRLLAEGYTAAADSDPAAKAVKFAEAIEALRLYKRRVARLPGQQRAEQVTVDLLIESADILIDEIGAEIAVAQ